MKTEAVLSKRRACC